MRQKYYLLFVLFFVLPCTFSFGQKLQEILLQQEKDSTFMQVYSVDFDDDGHFLYHKEIHDTTYLFQNGKVKIAANPYSYGNMTECHDYTNAHEHYFIKYDLPFIIGPTKGDDLGYELSPKSGKGIHQIVSLEENNRVNLYYDGKLYKSFDTTRNSPTDYKLTSVFKNWDWAALSNNGNILLNYPKGGIDSLFLNNHLVDTCNNAIVDFAVNNSGDYTYIKVYKVLVGENTRYIKVFHSKDTSINLGELNTSAYYLFNHGGYYYLNYPAQSHFQLINNHLYHLQGSIETIYVRDTINHFVMVKKEDQTFELAANGKVYPLNYDEIYCPAIDEKGNLALIGKRDYYLYQWINGKEIPEPISRFGVRPSVLHISPSGDFIAAFQTDDSTLIYRNNELLFSGTTKEITIANQYQMLRSQNREHRQVSYKVPGWFYIQVREKGYILYDGKLSAAAKPFSYFSRYSDDQRDDQIVVGEINENGYFVVIRRPNNAFELITNHQPPITFSANRIFNLGYLNEEYLTFYGVKDFSLFQFKFPKL